MQILTGSWRPSVLATRERVTKCCRGSHRGKEKRQEERRRKRWRVKGWLRKNYNNCRESISWTWFQKWFTGITKYNQTIIIMESSIFINLFTQLTRSHCNFYRHINQIHTNHSSSVITARQILPFSSSHHITIIFLKVQAAKF